jgi:hypothetical protein
MRSRSLLTATVALVLAPVLAGPLASAATAPSHAPTPKQIRAAVARATRSPDLWTTINICNTKRHTDQIGVRGQMPALGFTSRLYMDVLIEYWSETDKRFNPTNARKQIPIGRAAHAVHQSGAIFQFAPAAGILRGVVTFEWRLAGKVIGRVVRKTGHGYSHVDFGDPPGYSAGICAIG